MLYEDKHKVIYCSVPKTGCTTMKRMMVLLQDLFTLDQLNNTKVTVTYASYLLKAFKLCRVNSIRLCYQTKKNTDYLLKTMERFVSTYHKFASKDSESVYQIIQKKNSADLTEITILIVNFHLSLNLLGVLTGLCDRIM